jgi:hAT family C-terminal dimerisation region
LERFDVGEEMIESVWIDIVHEQLMLDGISVDDPKFERKKEMCKLHAQGVREALSKTSKFFQDEIQQECDVDLLSFWRKAVSDVRHDESDNYSVSLDDRGDFKALSRVARMLFCIPAGSAPSEREFSSSGRIYDDMRNRMSAEMLEMLVVVRSFLRSPLFNFERLLEDLKEELNKE